MMDRRRGHAIGWARSRGLLLRVLLAATLLALGAVPLGRPVPAQADEAISVVGLLPYPGVEFVGGGNFVLGVNPDATSVYSVVGIPNTPDLYLFEHRIDTDRIGTPRRSEAPFPLRGNFSPLKVSFDPDAPRAFVLGTDPVTTNFSIGEVDLETLETGRQVDLGTILPGFAGLGLTFSQTDNRLYLVGEFVANQAGVTFSKVAGRPVGPGPAMVALDADTLSVAWVHMLVGCTQVLEAANIGSLIARSPHRPVLYTFCSAEGTAAGYANASQLAPSALVRVHFDPDAGPADAMDFDDEFFPVAGRYKEGFGTGIAGFDPATERVFVQSLSRQTPGAWVFDGRQAAWMGFVAAPDNYNFFLGINPANGRYYMGSSTPSTDGGVGYINVTDGRATPISQGRLVRGVYPRGFIVADPTSNRLFTSAWPDPQTELAQRPMVFADNTSSIVPLEPVDYDGLTHDLPNDQSRINYSASTGGFGNRYKIVGGYEGFTSGTPEQTQTVVAAPGLAFGDRGATFSSVPSVDLRPGGAAATAAIAQADEATSADTTDADHDTGGTGVARFPYGVQSCLDGDGTKVESSEDPDDGSGHASVICDLANQQTIATATYDGSSSADGMTVSASSFDTRTYRDPDGGAVTEVTAVAEGISIGGLYSIDRVSATVTTRANGRPGTSGVLYERKIEGADPGDGSGPKNCVMRYETGKDPQRSADCDDLAGPFDGAVGSRLELRFPEPELTATPQGAFASLQETEADYLNGLTLNNDEGRYLPAMEVTVYHDSTEKSRTVMHLAAVRANSILTRSPAGTIGPEPAATSTPSPVATVPPSQPGETGSIPAIGGPDTQPLDPGPGGPTVAPTDPAAAPPLLPTGPVATGWTANLRSPSEAALIGALLILFGWPAVDVVRRRRLLQVLSGP